MNEIKKPISLYLRTMDLPKKYQQEQDREIIPSDEERLEQLENKLFNIADGSDEEAEILQEINDLKYEIWCNIPVEDDNNEEDDNN